MQSYAIKSNVLFLDRPFRKYILTVRDLPTEGKPRERLMKQGPEALSLRELLSVVLNTGTTKEGVLEMADRIIRDYGEKSILAEKDANKLSREMNIPIV
ncbi:MAG: UPF0758 domain-containing protein, partial [Patescibacteria group bacterium]